MILFEIYQVNGRQLKINDISGTSEMHIYKSKIFVYRDIRECV